MVWVLEQWQRAGSAGQLVFRKGRCHDGTVYPAPYLKWKLVQGIGKREVPFRQGITYRGGCSIAGGYVIADAQWNWYVLLCIPFSGYSGEQSLGKGNAHDGILCRFSVDGIPYWTSL